jgi:hypothetical protein
MEAGSQSQESVLGYVLTSGGGSRHKTGKTDGVRIPAAIEVDERRREVLGPSSLAAVITLRPLGARARDTRARVPLIDGLTLLSNPVHIH